MKQLFKAPQMRRALGVALALALALSLGACKKSDDSKSGGGTQSKTDVVLATTTSTQDSGLLDVLEPKFEEAYPQYNLQIIAVGTGEALKLGETKDADVLLVHAKADEEKFVAAGYGIERRDVMYNDFIIVGPAADPSGVKGSADTTAAMVAIASGKAPFVSRADDSGTNKKELKLWAAASVVPTATGDWYVQTGQGMGDTLKIASEKQAYTLTDRATYLSLKDSLDLEISFEGDKGLFNQYGVIVVKGAKNEQGGQAFFDWILSADTQKFIGEFGVDTYAQALFTPNAK